MPELPTIWRAILPLFHGFGCGVCVTAAFMVGAKSILVPTLYDSLTRDDSLEHADLTCLHAAFSEADTLPRPVKERFERLVADHGGKVKLLEG